MVDRLVYQVNYFAEQVGADGRQPWLTFGDTFPIAQGQWAQMTLPVDQAGSLDLYDAQGAGHIVVRSEQLMQIDINGQSLYGNQFMLGMSEIDEVEVTPLGRPVDRGEATGITDTSLQDTNKQWTLGLLRGLEVCEEWCDNERAFDVILDVNGRLASLRQEAPVDWTTDTLDDGTVDPDGESGVDKALAAIQDLIEDSPIGEGHAEIRWVESTTDGKGRFEIHNLQRDHAPVIRPTLPTFEDWLVRLGLFDATPLPATVMPLGLRMRITSGTVRGEHRTITDTDGDTIEWSEDLDGLAVGDSYRLLRTSEPATIEWIVVDRGAR